MMIKTLTGSTAACSAIALCATFLLSSPASAAVIFNSATVLASASAEADPIGAGSTLVLLPGGNVGATTNTAFVGVFGELSSAYQQAVSPTGIQGEATDIETTELNLVSAAAGTAEFTGSTTANVNVAGADSFAGNNPEYLLYQFTVDRESALTLSYVTNNNSASAALFPGYSAYVYNQTTDFLAAQGLQNVPPGSVTSSALQPGTYTLKIDNSAGNDLAQSIAQLQSGSAIGDFAFTISPVPEPATWGTMLIGFGVVGGLMRRRRQAQSVAAI